MRLNSIVRNTRIQTYRIVNLVRQLGQERSLTKERSEEIYEVLMEYTLPFALQKSDLEEHEVLDYIHDFYVDLQDNRVRWVGGVRKGTYDLEKLNPQSYPAIITRFFFQYVTRAKYMEGRWADRRVLGRRTHAEVLNGSQAPHHHPPSTSYEMHLRGDCEQFLQSLSEHEKVVLSGLVEGLTLTELSRSTGISYKRHNRVLNRLQIKANKFFIEEGDRDELHN